MAAEIFNGREVHANDGLEFVDVCHNYGKKNVLHNLNFSIGSGRVLCLLGPSGCGKSTTLRVAAGLERIKSGSVIIRGDQVATSAKCLPPEARRTGLMFQDYALFPHLNVLDNVTFGLSKGDKKKKRETALSLLERLGIISLANEYPHTLSGGEQQRVALARALAPNPILMLLDEPFSGLDRGLRTRVRNDTLDILRELSVATVLVTHDAEEAMLMADDIALMRYGKIVQIGCSKELYSRPNSAFAASFLGEVNIIDGIVKNGTVSTPLGQIKASFKDGCNVKVYVRPEDLKVESPSECGLGLAEAEIIESHCLGALCLARLKLSGDFEPITARMETTSLSEVGKRVSIRLDPARSFVFPASQEL